MRGDTDAVKKKQTQKTANVQNTDSGGTGVKTSQQRTKKKYKFVWHNMYSNWLCACTGQTTTLR